MTSRRPVFISAAVEGAVDEAVLRRLLAHVGAEAAVIYGKQGKQALLQRIGGYNVAARYSPWVVLVDLDQDAACAPPFRATWLPQPSAGMCFRVAVRSVESWLLGDRESISAFLGVAISRVPSEPDVDPDPKARMVELARKSRRWDIRQDMTPRPASGLHVGPAYSSRLIEFAHRVWRPAAAIRTSRASGGV